MWLKYLALFVGVFTIVFSFYLERRYERKRKDSKEVSDIVTSNALEQNGEYAEKSDYFKQRMYDEQQVKDNLNRFVNKKMLELNEFSSQLMEKIDTNQKEVMFLYDMLSEKEKELRDFFEEDLAGKLEEKVEQACNNDMHMKYDEDMSVKNQAYKIKEDYMGISHEEEAEINNVLNIRESSIASESKDAYDYILDEESTNVLGDLYTEIIEMKKRGMRNIDISRELQLGTGEVNLILNLYKSKIV